MTDPTIQPTARTNPALVWLGVILLVVGFCGHFFAARAIAAGNPVAYRDHMAGFFGATVLSLIIVGVLGHYFWRGRPGITLLIVGVLQALLGWFVYVNRYEVGHIQNRMHIGQHASAPAAAAVRELA